jgi:hypothetical protein
MSPLASDDRDRRRDPAWERELAQRLRREPESFRLAFIEDLATATPVVALDPAHRYLASNSGFERLPLRALAEADASSIRFRLECVVPRLGFRESVKLLRREQEAHPVGVEKALYRLTLFSDLPGFSAEEIRSLREAQPVRGRSLKTRDVFERDRRPGR